MNHVLSGEFMGVDSLADDDIRVPAGWYPDPLGLPQLRWWDNHQWTEHVSDARMPMDGAAAQAAQQETSGAAAGQSSYATPGAYATPGTTIPTVVRSTRLSFADPFIDFDEEGEEPHVAAPDGDRGDPSATSAFGEQILSLEALQAPAQEEAEDVASPAHRLAAGHVPAGAPMGHAYNLDTRFDDLLGLENTSFETEFPTRRSMHRDRAGANDYTPPTHANTGAVWTIALIPLLMLVLGLLFLLSGLVGDGSSYFLGLVVLVPYAVSIGLAFTDMRELQELGYSRPAHWTWSFLTPPVYLVLRSRRVAAELGGRGYSPFVTWLLMGAIIVASAVIAPGLVISLTPQTFSADAANSVETQAASFGVQTSVACPPTPPLRPGDSFTCAGRTSAGEDVKISVSLQRALGWISWRVDDWGGMSR